MAKYVNISNENMNEFVPTKSLFEKTQIINLGGFYLNEANWSDSEKDKYDKQVKELNNQIDSLTAQLKNLDPSSQEYFEISHELDDKRTELDNLNEQNSLIKDLPDYDINTYKLTNVSPLLKNEGINYYSPQNIIVQPTNSESASTGYSIELYVKHNMHVSYISNADNGTVFISSVQKPGYDMYVNLFYQALPEIKGNKIYGVKYVVTSSNTIQPSSLERTDDSIGLAEPVPAIDGGTGSSPFDNIMPWAGINKMNNSEVGEVVMIPKFYYKWTQAEDLSTLQLQISMQKLPDFFCSPAHMDRGDGKGERDVIYVSRYNLCTNNKSTSGLSPKNRISPSEARTICENLGETVHPFDIATLITIQMLYLVEFADWNSQEKIGYGGSPNVHTAGAEIRPNTGTTDKMRYHTGTMQKTRETYGEGVQYRYIEDFWSNTGTWIDGLKYNYRYKNIDNGYVEHSVRIYRYINPENYSIPMKEAKGFYRSSFIGVDNIVRDFNHVKNIKIENTTNDAMGFYYPCSSMISTTTSDPKKQGISDSWDYNNGKILIGQPDESEEMMFYSNTDATYDTGLFGFRHSTNDTDQKYQRVGCRAIILP